jgi:microcystin-dependent protein
MTPYVGEIRMFAGNFAPAGWAFCNGQLLPISENETLFNLIGTTYGGDGQETFALPNVQSRVPIHLGTSSASGVTYQIGEAAGVETVTLTQNQMPIHSHPMLANSQTVTTELPTNAVLASSPAIDSFASPIALTSLAASRMRT